VRGTGIFIIDVTPQVNLQNHLLEHSHELETAMEELQSTNEELETTNEELQSTNEELETTNEELQSTNEELETMNEELQHRSTELNTLNLYLESIMASFRGGVTVVDHEMRVQLWNTGAEDLWGLRAEETIGQYFLNLDIGLPMAELRDAIRNVLSGKSRNELVTLNAVNRRGKDILCKVRVVPLVLLGGETRGGIIVQEDVKDADDTLAQRQ
jgi:two-component system, chemotaxis family, CheB/CheR fusion protein